MRFILCYEDIKPSIQAVSNQCKSCFFIYTIWTHTHTHDLQRKKGMSANACIINLGMKIRYECELWMVNGPVYIYETIFSDELCSSTFNSQHNVLSSLRMNHVSYSDIRTKLTNMWCVHCVFRMYNSSLHRWWFIFSI